MPEAPLERLHAAMRYSCLAPGKRLRPALCLATAEALNPESLPLVLDAACSVEMVHAFSLIHDDLPAIDNDDLRRGMPTCHIQFGEATAILAGDALFALAFDALSRVSAPAERVVKAVQLLAACAGSAGLVGGEVVDIESEGLPPTENRLDFIHRNKTGALIKASCVIGAILAGGDEQAITEFAEFGDEIGLAFQIADDILNEIATAEQLGKAVGSDRERQKATYPSLYGIEASKARATALVEQAGRRMERFGPPARPLVEMATFVATRLS